MTGDGLRLRLLACLFLGCLTAVSGCSSGAAPNAVPGGPKGTVSGKVLLKDQPVPAGCTVTFTTEKVNVPAMTTTAADGSYSLEIAGTLQIPVGLYKVTVKAPAAPPMSDAEYEAMMKNMKADETGKLKDSSASTTAIPAMYQSTGTTPLKFEVKEGSNTYDIKLSE